MSQANELLTKLQAETIDVIKAQQETMLAAAKQWSEAMSSMVPAAAAAMPNMPSMPNLPSMPSLPGVPDMADMAQLVGDPTEMLDASFAFAAELLTMNRKFAKDLIAVSKPAPVAAAAPKKSK